MENINLEEIMANLDKEYEEKEKLRDKIKNNIETYLNEVLEYSKDNNINNDSIFYNDKLRATNLKEYFDLLCDELLDYGTVNYLVYTIDGMDSSIVCKYNDKLIEVSKLVGQGTYISLNTIKEEDLQGRGYFTLEQYKENYVFDTLKERLNIAKEEISRFLEDIEYLELSKEDVINIIKTI